MLTSCNWHVLLIVTYFHITVALESAADLALVGMNNVVPYLRQQTNTNYVLSFFCLRRTDVKIC